MKIIMKYPTAAQIVMKITAGMAHPMLFSQFGGEIFTTSRILLKGPFGE